MKPQYILLSLCLVLAGCSYLDLEPEKKGTLQEVFEDRTSAEKFLYGCYGYLPASNDFNGEPQVWSAGDEVALTSQWGTDWHWAKAAHTGQISAAEPLYNYWSHHKSKKQPSRCAAYDLYGGIRQCYTFIDMVDGVPNASDGEKARWKAEAKFLIAYFHYSLLRLYGPICLVNGIIPNDAPEEVYYPTRRPYDECVSWIARKFDEAAGELKASRAYSALDMGRANYVAALAIKSRMLLYAASPLFNGNSEYYADFKNKNGEQLISQTYDKEKWKVALDATEEAIAAAKQEGYKLFQFKSEGTSLTPEEIAYQTARNMVTTLPREISDNPDMIWVDSRSPVNSQQMYAIRGLTNNSVSVPYGGVSPSFRMVETFLTKNGLPIDKDPEFDYPHRYDPVQDEYGEWTAKMHLGRETRFYADIAYDRAHDYELRGNWTLYLRMGAKHPVTKLTMGNDPNRDMQTINGYLAKKTVHPNSYFPNNSVSNGRIDWAWPLIRMTELYLNYAEAYVEYHGTLAGQALQYMNEIRDRVGVPRIEDAWKGIPGKDYREIIRQERTIELMFEGHRYFDARRWKIAHLTFAEPSKRWNCFPTGFTTTNVQPYDSYLTIMPSIETTKIFEQKHYLYPIDAENISSNRNLVQNPGW